MYAAAVSGSKDIAELLLAKGADVNVRDIDGETPLHAAIVMKRKDVAALLRQHGGHE